MKMHEHVTCKFKCIMGSAQSKPTSTQHSNKVNTHLKCMKHCYIAHVMAMHEVLNSLKQHPTQNFLQNLINFEKPPKILQKPKLRSEKKEMHD